MAASKLPAGLWVQVREVGRSDGCDSTGDIGPRQPESIRHPVRWRCLAWVLEVTGPVPLAWPAATGGASRHGAGGAGPDAPRPPAPSSSARTATYGQKRQRLQRARLARTNRRQRGLNRSVDLVVITSGALCGGRHPAPAAKLVLISSGGSFITPFHAGRSGVGASFANSLALRSGRHRRSRRRIRRKHSLAPAAKSGISTCIFSTSQYPLHHRHCLPPSTRSPFHSFSDPDLLDLRLQFPAGFHPFQVQRPSLDTLPSLIDCPPTPIDLRPLQVQPTPGTGRSRRPVSNPFRQVHFPRFLHWAAGPNVSCLACLPGCRPVFETRQ